LIGTYFRPEGFIMSGQTTETERENLSVHVDMCAIRYQNLDTRLTNVEDKITEIHEDIKDGNQSLVKVLVGAAGTIIAGLLSTIVVILLNS